MEYVNKLIDYIYSSPTCFQAVQNAAAILDEAGFEELRYGARWELKRGGRYYTVRNMSALAAFRIPEEGFAPFAIIESHSDSPCMRIKINTDVPSGEYMTLNTEIYGGAINNSWFDRPLTAAGRVTYRTENGITSGNVNLEKPLFVIPSLAPHLNREANNGFKAAPHVDLQPLMGSASSGNRLKEMTAEKLGISADDILMWDMYVVSCEKGYVFGMNDEYFSSPRIDNLSNVYSSINALINCTPNGMIPFSMIFNKEEIGSTGIDGADSKLIADIIDSIAYSFGADEADLREALVSSFALSADNGHAVHPNHPESSDKLDRCYMNKGIMIKQSPSYTTDGFSGALLMDICRRSGLPVQVYSNRADQRGGSTLGIISIAQVSVPTVDIGIPQLAMHSVNETAGCADAEDMDKAMTAFLSCKIRSTGDGCCSIEI